MEPTNATALSAEAMHLRMQQALGYGPAMDVRLQARVAILQEKVARLEQEKAQIASERDALRERLMRVAEGPVPAGAD